MAVIDDVRPLGADLEILRAGGVEHVDADHVRQALRRHARVGQRRDEDLVRRHLRVFGDLVRASLDDGGNLPRIAPARAGGELRWERDALRASLGAVRYMEQDRVAALESVTPGYTLVDAHFAWHYDRDYDTLLEIFVDATNLLDEEARPHTSFLKDLAPLPGRGFEAGIRVYF